ncbi:MAG: hypothetical protein QOE05_2751 [Actinomycetota bacterium]|nr:hypothetical protein [Actinomycetota bacterium]
MLAWGLVGGFGTGLVAFVLLPEEQVRTASVLGGIALAACMHVRS